MTDSELNREIAKHLFKGIISIESCTLSHAVFVRVHDSILDDIVHKFDINCWHELMTNALKVLSQTELAECFYSDRPEFAIGEQMLKVLKEQSSDRR